VFSLKACKLGNVRQKVNPSYVEVYNEISARNNYPSVRSKTENNLGYKQRRGYRSLFNGVWLRDVTVTAAVDGGQILNVSHPFSVMCVANNTILLFSIPDEVTGFFN
jgi:hypothetical protein